MLNASASWGISMAATACCFIGAPDERIGFACSSDAAFPYHYKIAHQFGIEMAEVIPGFVARDLLMDKHDLTVIGDKGFISAPLAAELLERSNIRLLTLKRRDQHEQVSPEVRRLINQIRQIIETVNGQLTEQFGIETNHAHSFWGLCARLYTKLTAHTLCIYRNRLLGNPEWLQIKALAFPI
jgi:hypothetical protein